jgi:sugar O-acyltransferase (sialic acid O-acetyltransferase NeuD family)
MRPLIIFGAGELAEVAHYYFTRIERRRIGALVVDPEYLSEESKFGVPIIAIDDATACYPARDYDAFVAIGYTGMNSARAAKANELKTRGYRLTSFVSPRANVYTDAVGENCFLLEDNTVQPFVTIGDNVTLWSGNHIGHHTRIEDNVYVSSHVVISGGVTIGKNSFLGVNATIADHVNIAAFTLIGAGALILADTDPEGVYVSPSPAEKRKLSSLRLKSF